jgi:hypothetical protein
VSPVLRISRERNWSLTPDETAASGQHNARTENRSNGSKLWEVKRQHKMKPVVRLPQTSGWWEQIVQKRQFQVARGPQYKYGKAVSLTAKPFGASRGVAD